MIPAGCGWLPRKRKALYNTDNEHKIIFVNRKKDSQKALLALHIRQAPSTSAIQQHLSSWLLSTPRAEALAHHRGGKKAESLFGPPPFALYI